MSKQIALERKLYITQLSNNDQTNQHSCVNFQHKYEYTQLKDEGTVTSYKKGKISKLVAEMLEWSSIHLNDGHSVQTNRCSSKTINHKAFKETSFESAQLCVRTL